MIEGLEEGGWVVCSRSYNWKVLEPLDLSDSRARALNLDFQLYTACFVL